MPLSLFINARNKALNIFWIYILNVSSNWIKLDQIEWLIHGAFDFDEMPLSVMLPESILVTRVIGTVRL